MSNCFIYKYLDVMITIFNNTKKKEIHKKFFSAKQFLGFASYPHSKKFPEVPFLYKFQSLLLMFNFHNKKSHYHLDSSFHSSYNF
nr:MAG TPA: hypothetical protein [Caudoviricetes sp.]